MWQMVFSNVFVNGQAIAPYVYSLFYSSGEVLALPSNFT